MSGDLIERLREASAVPCDARGGFGSRIRSLQSLIREAADAAPGPSHQWMRERLASACQEAGGQRAWGRKHGVSQGQISDVLAGKQELSPAMANALGFLRVVTFKPFKRETGH